MFAFVYIDLPSHLGSREQVAREASTSTSIATSLCKQSCLSDAKFLCVEYAATNKDIQRTVLLYISGKDIFGVELQSAEEKTDTTV